MRTSRPKEIRPVDDDGFAASFVLSPRDVEAALAADPEESANPAPTTALRSAANVRKSLLCAAGAAVVLVVAALWWLASW